MELSQSYWVEWEMEQPAAARATRHGDRRRRRRATHAYVRATTTLSVPQWARYDLQGSLDTLEDGIAHARAAGDDSLLAGGPLFRVPARAHVAGPPRRGRAAAPASASTSPTARTTRSRLGLPLAALTQIAVARGDFAAPSSTRTRRSSCSACPATTGPPASYLPPWPAPTSPCGSTSRRARRSTTWAETADELDQASVDLFSRYVDACERDLAVQG